MAKIPKNLLEMNEDEYWKWLRKLSYADQDRLDDKVISSKPEFWVFYDYGEEQMGPDIYSTKEAALKEYKKLISDGVMGARIEKVTQYWNVLDRNNLAAQDIEEIASFGTFPEDEE